MIIGIGTDITDIRRIAEVLGGHDARFVDRCFSAAEKTRVEESAKEDASRRAAGYARRWSAKEACAKALGLGIREGIFLKDISVENDGAGKPSLVLSGGAARRLADITPAGMRARVHVSLSDEPPMALAFVVIETEKE